MRDYDDAPVDTGRVAYHEADEGWNPERRVVLGIGKDRRDVGCCRIRIVEPFWDSREQQFAYENAVEANPRESEEGALSYAMRISGVVEKRFPGMTTKRMPSAKQTRREKAAALQRLREQAARLPAGERPEEDLDKW